MSIISHSQDDDDDGGGGGMQRRRLPQLRPQLLRQPGDGGDDGGPF